MDGPAAHSTHPHADLSEPPCLRVNTWGMESLSPGQHGLKCEPLGTGRVQTLINDTVVCPPFSSSHIVTLLCKALSPLLLNSFFKIFMGVQLTYNVVYVSGVQKSDSFPI